jgi:glycosyltransferase involved in cell wall biosynthesis
MFTTTPAVTVLMTAYNREAFIGDAIESVLAQTWEDFELVIADDASSDRTVAIAQRFAARDRRIRIVINERNLGDYPNRNHAATFARGTFLKYHDSDDVMYPHCLSTMVELLSAHPAAGFALTASRAWSGGPVPMLLSPREAYRREYLGFGMFMLGPASALFRRSVFEALGRFPEAGPHSDHLFWLQACRSVPVLLVPGDLFWWRTHPGQHLRSPQALSDRIVAERRAWEALAHPDCPLDESEREQARRNHAWNTAKLLRRDIARGRARLCVQRLQHSGLSLTDWLRYLRRARRSADAGTLLDVDGQYVVPARVQDERAQTPRAK